MPELRISDGTVQDLVCRQLMTRQVLYRLLRVRLANLLNHNVKQMLEVKPIRRT